MMAESTDLQVRETEKQEIAEQGPERTRARLAFVPRVDIYETEDSITLVADMPGVDESSVDITLENRVLTVKGFVEPEWPENYSLAYAEYQVGDYERTFTLTDVIDEEGIGATVRDGVLRLRLPKARPEARKITVRAG
jgi:HSP20 family molecular chaperone IbpA